MPRWLSSAPRKKLPPPTTMATCTPSLTADVTCLAMPLTTSGSMPICPPPMTSPESLSRTRRMRQRYRPVALGTSSAADLDVREPRHRDPSIVQQRLHGLLGVLHGRLLEEHV